MMKHTSWKKVPESILLSACWLMFSCAPPRIYLVGAGATFPEPLYRQLFDAYTAARGIDIHYNPLGSSGGIRQISMQNVDFGATDAFLNAAELEAVATAGNTLLHIPTALGAVALVYNLPGKPQLRLTGESVAGIYLGEITFWNDSAIQQINPNCHLPEEKIQPIYRLDGSGTTFLFTTFLSSRSPVWAQRLGRGKIINWPAGQGAVGNLELADQISKIPGSIGYVNLNYAVSNKLACAAVLNSSGRYIYPDTAAASAAARMSIHTDTRIMLTESTDPDAYPITGFTWLLIWQEQSYALRTRRQARSLCELCWWIIHEGQRWHKELNYAPLPPESVSAAEEILYTVTYQGKPILRKKK